jgi:hypothetical protein
VLSGIGFFFCLLPLLTVPLLGMVQLLHKRHLKV